MRHWCPETGSVSGSNGGSNGGSYGGSNGGSNGGSYGVSNGVSNGGSMGARAWMLQGKARRSEPSRNCSYESNANVLAT